MNEVNNLPQKIVEMTDEIMFLVKIKHNFSEIVNSRGPKESLAYSQRYPLDRADDFLIFLPEKYFNVT